MLFEFFVIESIICLFSRVVCDINIIEGLSVIFRGGGSLLADFYFSRNL